MLVWACLRCARVSLGQDVYGMSEEENGGTYLRITVYRMRHSLALSGLVSTGYRWCLGEPGNLWNMSPYISLYAYKYGTDDSSIEMRIIYLCSSPLENLGLEYIGLTIWPKRNPTFLLP